MELVELKEAENSFGKIECIHNVNDHLYVGTSDGHLILYKIFRKIAMETGEMQVTTQQIAIRNVEKNKKIVDIKSDPVLNVLFVQYKNSHRIAISVGRKIMIIHYTNNDYQVFDKEKQLPEPALAMVWYGNTICCGMKREYSMIKLDELMDNVVTVLPLEKNIKPLMIIMEDEVLLRMTNIGVFVFMRGKRRCTPSTRNSVAWSAIPNALAICFPYIVAVFPKKIEIYDLYSQMLVQTIQWLCNAKIMSGDRKGVFISAQNKVFLLSPIAIEKQVDNLIENGRCVEAFELLDKLFEGGPKEKELLRQKMLLDAGFKCLFETDLKRAFDYFNEANFDVRELLMYFPEIKPTNFVSQRKKNTNVESDLTKQFLNILNKRNADKQKENEIKAKDLYAETKKYLIHLLQEKRKPKKETEEQRELDMGLLKLYLEIDDSVAIENLLSNHNSLKTEEARDLLIKDGHYFYIGLLFKGKGKIDESLQMFRDIGEGVYAEEGRDEIGQTVKILSSIDDFNLISQYAGWVIEKNPEEGIKIFTTKRENPIKPDLVIKFLSERNVQTDLLIGKYLEYLIVTEKNTEPKYHTQLAVKYIDAILNEKKKIYRQSMYQIKTKVKKAGSEGGLLGELRYKLLIHLSQSPYYHSPSLITRLQQTDLYEEMVILYSKLKQHREALSILLFDLEDEKGAEKYCLIQTPTTDEGEDNYFKNPERSDVFCILLDLCFNSKKDKVKFGLKILNKHATLIDPTKVLKILPKDLLTTDIEEFLRKSILTGQHNFRDYSIVKNLSAIENVQTNYKLIEAQKRRVIITSKRVCPICSKSIGNAVFAVYPDLTVVHFYCFEKINKKKR